MLSSFTFKNFKSYEDATLPLAPLTTLVGANASGKSNALEAIRFLSWLAEGHKLSSLAYQINGDDRVIRGRIQDLPRMGSGSSFGIGCVFEEVTYNRLELAFSVREELHIAHEKCDSNSGEVLYETQGSTQGVATDISVAYNNFARGGKKPQVKCTDQQAIFLQLASAARFHAGHKKSQQVIPKVTAALERSLAQIMYLDPVPGKMREPSYPSDSVLQREGENLSAVLYRLWEDPQNRKDLLQMIHSLPEQDIVGLEFLKGLKGEVLLQLQESVGGEEQLFDATLLSDGTLRVLGIAAALLSAAPGSLVIIEEADNGVHPNRTQQLLASMEAIAKERALKILITTHNPAMLNSLPASAVGDVVFCYRDPQLGHSRLVRLSDMQDYPELVGQGGLGDLLAEGVMERFIKYHPGPEKKRQQALEWLASITES